MTVSPTQLTPIVDKNGVATSRHKRVDSPSPSLRTSPLPTVEHSHQRESFNLTINEDAPFPQANSLSKLSAVVDLVMNGASTPSGISVGIGSESNSARAGSYYGDSLVYLGLAEKHTDEDFTEYVLTSDGNKFAMMSPEERHAVLFDAISNMEMVQIYREDGADALAGYIETVYGYQDATVQRRVACISSWSDQSDSADLHKDISVQQGVVSKNTSEALEAVAEERRLAREAKRERAKPKDDWGTDICLDCGMQKSVSGACGC